MLRNLLRQLTNRSKLRTTAPRGLDEGKVSGNEVESRESLNAIEELLKLGQLAAALVKMENHLGAHQVSADFLANLGAVYQHVGEFAKGRNALRTAVQLDSENETAWYNLANLELAQANYAEAQVSFAHAITLKPQSALFNSSRLGALNYDPERSQEEIVEQHLEWGRSVEARLPLESAGDVPGLVNESDVLRIGYVSADLYAHSVYSFISGVLFHHDRNHFEVYCYHNGAIEDETTAKLRSAVPRWRNVKSLTDEGLADCIRKDRIDVLVDLSGHTQGNRLEVFARRPAPVQVTWLGYPQTTGLSRIDYRLSDRFFDPPGDELGSEKVWRLPRSAICFLRPKEPKPTLASRLGPSTPLVYASVNHFRKISIPTMTAWGNILSRAPGTRLRCYIQFGELETVREFVYERFMACGAPTAQIELVPWAPTAQFLDDLAEVDIVLDPFPYNGGTTTNLCLWAGVPVLTLVGRTPLGRCGFSLLSALELNEFIANSVEEYVELGIGAAANPQAIRSRKHEVHQRYLGSALHDYAGFTNELEDAFREMRRLSRCNDGSRSSPS